MCIVCSARLIFVFSCTVSYSFDIVNFCTNRCIFLMIRNGSALANEVLDFLHVRYVWLYFTEMSPHYYNYNER